MSKNEEIDKIKSEDLLKRSTGFNEEMIPLLGKYKLGLGAVAFLLPDGRIAAKPQLFDDSEPKVAEKTPAKPSEDDAVPQV